MQSTTDITNMLIKIPYLLAAISQLLLYSYYGQSVINEVRLSLRSNN